MEKETAEHTGQRTDIGVTEANAYGDEHVQGLEIPNITWYKHKGLRKLYALIPILFLNATINGYDSSLLNGLQSLKPWQNHYGHPVGSELGLFNAIYNIGGISALPFSAYIADILGRKTGICIGLVMVFIGTIIQVIPAGDHDGMFIGGRFLIGLGANISQGSSPVLVTELAHPQHRGRITTLYNSIYSLGAIIAAWTVFGTVKYTSNAGWQIPMAMQAAMPALQLLLLYFVPESPRWLCSKDRSDEALAILVKYHAAGDANDRFVLSEFHEIQETLRLEKINAKSGWIHFVKTPGNRKRLMLIAMVAFFSQCSGNGLVSYYLHTILDSVGITSSYDQTIINGGLSIWSLIVSCVACMFVDKIGRRPLFMGAAVAMLVVFSIWTACSAVYSQTGSTSAGSAVVAMIFLFNGSIGVAYPGLTVAYPVEILPFNLRAKGIAILYACKALASIFNQYVNPIGLEHLSWRYYFVYIAILILECFAVWFLFVETKGPTLEEIARLFDGEDANVAGKELIKGKVHIEEVEELEDAEATQREL